MKKYGYNEFFAGLFIGLVCGAVGGIILTPQSGEETRRRLANQAVHLRDSAQGFIDSAKNNLEQAADHLEGVFGSQEKALQRKLKDLRAELEKYSLLTDNVFGG